MGLIWRTLVFLDRRNFNLLYKSLVRPYTQSGNIAWSPFRKADINLIENMQRRATRFIPEINKLDYQERLEKLNLSTWAYRGFRGSIVETYKILHGLYDANCTNSLYERKGSNKCGHKFAFKTKLSRTSIRRIFQFTNSKFIEQPTREYVAEAPSTDKFKNRFDRRFRERNLLSDVDIVYTNV